MDLSQARALLGRSSIEVRPHDPEQDRIVLHALARWALRFCPVVAPDPPDGLLMDICGCQHLFGGEGGMIRTIVQAVRELGLTIRAAAAPTIGCAWAVARFGKESSISWDRIGQVLETLPVRALRIDPQVEAALSEVAIDRIGQLRVLPRHELVERFGPSLLRRLDQAFGLAHEAVEPIQPAMPIEVERELPEPIQRLDTLELLVRRLLDKLSKVLERQGRGVRRLGLRVHRIDAARLDVRVELSRPARDPAHLWKLLRPHVEKLHMGWGVEIVALRALSTGKLPHEQSRAWPEDRSSPAHGDDRQIAELVDLLGNRCGAPRVCRMHLVETYVPERCFVRRPAMESGLAAGGTPAAVVEADRPTKLLDRPVPVDVMAMAPEGPVVSLIYQDKFRKIIRTLGPERITPRWWLTESGAQTAPPRDYFKVQDELGQWWWIYRKLDTPKWFVHGVWA